MKILVALLTLMAITVTAQVPVFVSWLPNTDTNLAGYKVYQGPAEGVYTRVIDAGMNQWLALSCPRGTTIWFALTAYNTQTRESEFSTAVRIVTRTNSPMSVPTGFQTSPALAVMLEGSRYPLGEFTNMVTVTLVSRPVAGFYRAKMQDIPVGVGSIDTAPVLLESAPTGTVIE